jgi:putative acetyltransferase
VLFAALLLSACNRSKLPSSFAVVRADRQITGQSTYPLAIDPNRVGTYPPDAKSGAGYFYDEVLEYRVWLHPENGAKPLNGRDDYFVAFAQYEKAKTFSNSTPGAEEPLVLVRQLQWINEPERGRFIPVKEERIAEWQVRWLQDSKRTPMSIEEFMKHPHEAGPP